MFNVVEVPNPSNGAAYAILYNRVAAPHCTTRERQAEIVADFAKVLEWAAAQSPDVLAAYKWAAATIAKDIDRLIQSNEMNRAVNAKMADMPRPPE